MIANKDTLLTLPNSQKQFNELFVPLFSTTIGFEDIFSVMDKILEGPTKVTTPSYPPYNYIKLDSNHWQLEFAVAGFKREELNVQLQRNILTISGEKAEKETDAKRFVYRGFAKRQFKLVFPVQDDVDVESCELNDGVLIVNLVKPEIEQHIKQITIK